MLARSLHAFSTSYFGVPRWIMLGGPPPAGAPASLRCPVLVFVIELADRSYIVVDGGVDREREKPARSWGNKLLATVSPSSEARPEWTLATRLREMAISLDRIRCGLLTHCDFDHTGGIGALAGRPVLVHRPELANARSSASRFERLVRRQPLQHIPPAELREVDCPAPEPTRAIPPLYEVPEAEGAVALASLPGHTAGQVGVLVRLEGGTRVFLCADACYDSAAITAAAPFGLFPRLFAFDLPVAQATLDRLRAWHLAEPEVTFIPSHDARTGERVAGGPTALATGAASGVAG